MDLDIKRLQMMGLASANPLVKKTFSIKYHPLKPKTAWADPEVPEREEQEATGEISVYLRKMTAADQIFVHSAISQGQDAIYAMLHRSVYKEDGSRVFETVEDAMTVDLAMFSPLATLVMQINGALQKKITAEDEFFCEIALALGGRTIAEWKEALTAEELQTWLHYRERFGPLNPMLRFDAAVARFAMTQVKNGKMAMFMPWPKPEDEEATPEKVMALLKSNKE